MLLLNHNYIMLIFHVKLLNDDYPCACKYSFAPGTSFESKVILGTNKSVCLLDTDVTVPRDQKVRLSVCMNARDKNGGMNACS